MGPHPLVPLGASCCLYCYVEKMKIVSSVLFALFLVFPVASDAKATPGNLPARLFANCASLNRVYPRGVAVSVSASRIQRIRPTVNRSVYLRNIKLDRDKDGTACEKSGSSMPGFLPPSNSLSPIPTFPPSNIVTTVPVSCGSISPLVTIQNSVHRTTSHRLTTSFPDVMSGFEVSREVTGRITNNSSIEISVLSIVAKSLYLNGLNRDSVSYVANNSVQYFITPSSYRVAANSSLDFSYTYTQNVLSSFGAFVDSFQSSLEVKLYSLAPNCEFVR